MKLIIHDLRENEKEEFLKEFGEYEEISDQGTIRPCTGCFSCWNRTPGECIQKDGYENMGQLIHHADEVVIISRYTYGGLSSFVKNVFDRCLGYVLPHLKVIHGQTHHKKRYAENKPFTFIFYGHDLSTAEKESAVRYAKAACTNFRSDLKRVVFRECMEETEAGTDSSAESSGKIILLNASARTKKGNSAKFAEYIAGKMKDDYEIVNLIQYLDDLPSLMNKLEESSVIILCAPLYVDGLPSQLIRLMELFQKEYRGPSRKIYLLANMGLYESSQLDSMFSAVRQWSEKMRFEYCGGTGISAGELAGGLADIAGFGILPLKNIRKGMDQLAEAVNQRSVMKDIFAQPYLFPRRLYLLIANTGWKGMAEKNGIRNEDLFRRL